MNRVDKIIDWFSTDNFTVIFESTEGKETDDTEKYLYIVTIPFTMQWIEYIVNN
jgi:hypothetical protein